MITPQTLVSRQIRNIHLSSPPNRSTSRLWRSPSSSQSSCSKHSACRTPLAPPRTRLLPCPGAAPSSNHSVWPCSMETATSGPLSRPSRRALDASSFQAANRRRGFQPPLQALVFLSYWSSSTFVSWRPYTAVRGGEA